MGKVECQEAGITVEIFFEGYPCNVSHKGEIVGGLLPGSSAIRVEQQALSHSTVYAFITRNRGIAPLPKTFLPGTYMKYVSIGKRGPESYPGNSMRLLQLSQGGLVKVWELGFTRRNGIDFFVFQRNYAAQCFNDNGRIECPYFGAWDGMIKWLRLLLRDKISCLASLNTYIPEPLANLEDLRPQRGICRWFNVLRGEGCITVKLSSLATIDLHVNWKNIVHSSPIAFLIPGEEVCCSAMQRISLPRSQFRWEALNVRRP